MTSILYIDTHGPSHELLRTTLPSFSISSAYSTAEGFLKIKNLAPDIIITEIEFPDLCGFTFLEQLVHHAAHPPVIVISAQSSSYNIVRALRIGAEYFFPKPFNPEQLRENIHELVTLLYALQEKALLSAEEDLLEQFAGKSKVLGSLKYSIRLFAEAEAPVLITGESGSGKELTAHTLHKLSSRKNGPFKTVHCGAIPMSLLEAELYGSEPGAFTGAVRRPGHFEQAHGGTLFLDEIGEMSQEGQMKLLRIIEAQHITRIGGRRLIPIDVRIICATNRDINELVSQGRFRADLYFRIHTLPITLPPLRERKEDIPALALQFLQQFLQGPEMPDPPITYSALIKLSQYEWPGNVRELRNTLELAQVLSRGNTIKAEHIRVSYVNKAHSINDSVEV